jgi:hypothetical protein
MTDMLFNFIDGNDDAEDDWDALKANPGALVEKAREISRMAKSIDENLQGEALNQAVVSQMVTIYSVDESEVIHSITQAFKLYRRSHEQTLRRQKAESGGDTKRRDKQEARAQDRLCMFGELLDNIFDNYQKNLELGYEEDLEIRFLFTRVPNQNDSSLDCEIHSMIEIEENSGGIDRESASNLWLSRAPVKTRDRSSVGTHNRGLKLALPHLGFWQTIETWHFRDAEENAHLSGQVGDSWTMGGEPDPDGSDPTSSDPADYWHDENTYKGTPENKFIGLPDGDDWMLKQQGRTRITIRRLTESGMSILSDASSFNKLESFVQVVYGRLVRKLKENKNKNVTIGFFHSCNAYEPVYLSSNSEMIETLGAKEFIDLTSEDWVKDKFLEVPGFSPQTFTDNIDTTDGELRVKYIVGIPKNHRDKFPDDQHYNFSNYQYDPYPGFYFWGNNRLFTRADQPDTSDAWSPSATNPLDKNTTLPKRLMKLPKSQNGYFVAYIICEGEAEDIPFTYPVKWGVNRRHHYYTKMKDTAIRLGKAGQLLMALVMDPGARDQFMEPFIESEGNPGEDSGDTETNEGEGA